MNQLERAHLPEGFGHVLGVAVTGLMQKPVTLAAETHELVVLSDHLPGRPGEIDLKRGHVAAQIADVKHQLIGQILRTTPHHPAHTEGGKTELVA